MSENPLPMPIRSKADIDALEAQGELTRAENALIAGCQAGEMVVLEDGTRPSDPSDGRTVRADLLRYLILGGCDGCRVHERGVGLQGAWVAGALDLSFATARGATLMRNCMLEMGILAPQARLQRLDLAGSRLPGLFASRASVSGNVWLARLESAGPVDLVGAEIGGQLDCDGAKLDGGDGNALNAHSATITGGVFLRQLESTGTVDVTSAEIGGQLSCNGAKLDGGDGNALNAQGATITDGVFLLKLESTGTVDVNSAEIGGQLDCSGAKLNDDGGGEALNAQGATITGDVFLEGFKSSGEVNLAGAEIGGQLACTGARLDGGGGMALNAHSATITGGVFLLKLESTGKVNLAGAEIGGQLACNGAKLDGGDGTALNGQRMQVLGGMFWRDLVSVNGAVVLHAAHVADLVDDRASWEKVRNLSLVGMTYDNVVGPLDMDMRLAWLKKGARLGSDFHPQPYQQLAKVLRESGHRTEARRVLIANEREQRRAARRRWRAERRFRRDLRWYSINPSEATHAVLTRSAQLAGDLAARLAPVFNRLHGDPVGDRVPDPHERGLAQLNFRNRLLWANVKTRLRIAGSHIGDRILRTVTGYGYASLRSLWALALLIAAMAGLAQSAWTAGDFAPNSPVVLLSPGWTEIANGPLGASVNAAAVWSSGTGAGRDYETFNALAYAIDVVVPLVELGQEAAWSPSPARGWWGAVTFYAQKVFVLAGWIVAAIFAAAVTGLIRRDD
ncbi:hypothetical protein [Stappia sp.]|uniref:hypothetical protein n=1 Tax=Stappia sp. TaxID=1870903 RepID=UPI0032D99862